MLLISGLCPPGFAGGWPIGMRQAARGMLSSAWRADGHRNASRKALTTIHCFFINRFSRGEKSVLLIGRRVNGLLGSEMQVVAQFATNTTCWCPPPLSYPEVPLSSISFVLTAADLFGMN